MPSKIRTTVVLTKKAQKIKGQYGAALGLKGVLSVGLELFEGLSDTEKINRVGAAMRGDTNEGISLLDITLYNEGLISDEEIKRLWDQTPKKVKDSFCRFFDLAAIEDENAAARARGGPKHTRAKHKSLKSG